MNTTTDQAVTELDGTLLLNWLRLLGWTVAVECDEHGSWFGIGRYAGRGGDEHRIGATADGHGALVWMLFSQAINGLERERTALAA